MARSNSAQVIKMPAAMIGSGRVPLSYGSQNARNTNAAVQYATRRPATASPKRGRIERDSTHQMAMPARSVGRRIHIDAVVTRASSANTS